MRAYKTKLVVNNRERAYLDGAAWAARHTWNWMLSRHDVMFRADLSPRVVGGNAKHPDNPSIKKQFRAVIDSEFPELRRYSSQIVDNVAANLQAALTRFWRERKRGTVARVIAQQKRRGAYDRHLRRQLKWERKGVQVEPLYPQYKAYHKTVPSFSVSACVVQDGRVQIGVGRAAPEFRGHRWRLAERDYIPDGKHKMATFSRNAIGEWYVSVAAPYEPEPLESNGEVIGVDIGVATAVALSDGTMYANNRHLARYSKRLVILQRKLARQQKGSNGWKKTKARIGKLHTKVTRARQHDRHNVTSDIIYNRAPAIVRIEDLSVKNMTRAAKPKLNENETGYLPNRKRQKAGLNRALLEVAPYELRRQLEYKGKWAGVAVEAVNPAYTSQTCAQCGHVAAENRQTQSAFACVKCGHTAHADVNAARVIRDKNP